jgi:hypothetical protein
MKIADRLGLDYAILLGEQEYLSGQVIQIAISFPAFFWNFDHHKTSGRAHILPLLFFEDNFTEPDFRRTIFRQIG